MVKLSWYNDNREERELRSKQFVELSTTLSALLTKPRHGKQKAPYTYLEYASQG